MEIRTNNVPRFTIEAHELTATERADFDYLDWDAIDAGAESATFVRYLGRLYDLGEFMRHDDAYWHGADADTFFSATLVHFCDNGESVVMGRAYA